MRRAMPPMFRALRHRNYRRWAAADLISVTGSWMQVIGLNWVVLERTLGRRIFHLTPPHGFAAELSASSVLYLTAFAFHAPISTTHVITSAVMGVGATTRRSAVRWSVAADIAKGWVLTLPASAAAAAYGVVALLRTSPTGQEALVPS